MGDRLSACLRHPHVVDLAKDPFVGVISRHGSCLRTIAAGIFSKIHYVSSSTLAGDVEGEDQVLVADDQHLVGDHWVRPDGALVAWQFGFAWQR